MSEQYEEEHEVIYNTPFNVRGLFPEYSVDADYLLDMLKLGFLVTDNKTASAYRIDPVHGLIFYWTDATEKSEPIHPFITPQTPEQLDQQVRGFLDACFNGEIDVQLENEDLPVLNDSDITNVKGYRIYTGKFGRINEDSYAFLAVKPAYDCYGK